MPSSWAPAGRPWKCLLGQWSGINAILFPTFRHYAAEKAFQVAETAVKMHGRSGYYNDYPVHQFMRDIIPFGWWEGDAGANNLFYLTQLLGQRDGQDFANLPGEMKRTIESKQAAFYDGKLHSARFFIKNVLPQVDSLAAAMKSEDLSSMMIHEAGL